jgi:hypothetical protein
MEIEQEFFQVININEVDPGNTTVSVRCPRCMRQGTFERIGGIQDLRLVEGNVYLGHRRCPHPECRAHVFFVFRPETGKTEITPPEVIDFDATNLPDGVLSALKESITCHAAGCYRAAAVMVRRTLEELCQQEKAEGDDLKARLKALGTRVVLPPALLDGLDHLRVLGNDAAHVEAKVYDEIGQEEVEVALEFTKEVLKGVYQMTALLRRLQQLKDKGAAG